MNEFPIEVVREDANGEEVVAALKHEHFGQLWDFASRDINLSVAIAALTTRVTRGDFTVEVSNGVITLSTRRDVTLPSAPIRWFMRRIERGTN